MPPDADSTTAPISTEGLPPDLRHPLFRWQMWPLLAVALLVFTLGVSELWLYGHQGWCGARRGIAGINHVRYGFFQTRFGPVENYGTVEPKQFQYYWHHPVLADALVGVSYSIFGVHEWAGRLVPITCSLITYVLLLLLALRWWRWKGAVALGIVLAFLPINGFYGKFVNHEPVVLALGTTLVYLRVRFGETRQWRYVWGGVAVTAFGCFSDWPFYLILGAFGLIEAGLQLKRWRRGRDLRFLVAVTLTGIVGLFLVALYLLSLRKGKEVSLDGFKTLFSDRTTGGKGGSYGLKHLWERRNWYWDLLTPFAMSAGIAWVLAFVPRAFLRRLRGYDALIGGSLLAGGTWMVLFAQAAHIHEYWCFYLTPFLALSTAWLIVSAHDQLARFGKPGRLAAVGVFALALAGFAGWGGGKIVERQVTPSDVGPQQPEFRFRLVIFAKWVKERMAPDDELVLQDDFPVRQQTGWYLDARNHRVRLDSRFRKLPKREKARYLLLDRSHLPEDARIDILKRLARQHPVVFFDRYCLVDLRPGADTSGSLPSISAYRIAFAPAGVFWQWFESMVYPPHRVEESPGVAFQWAMTLGFEAEAHRWALRTTSPAAEPTDDPWERRRRLFDAVAYRNAQVYLDVDEAKRAAADARVAAEIGDAKLDTPLGDRLTVIGAPLWPYPGGRVAASIVIRVDEPAGKDTLRSWAHRRPAMGGFRLRPFGIGSSHRIWKTFEPLPGAWRRGMIYVDDFPAPRVAYPQEITFFVDRKSRKEERFLRPNAAGRDAAPLGVLALDADRRPDLDGPFAWIAAIDPACVPRGERLPAKIPAACLPALEGALDVATDVVFNGEDAIRIHGLRHAGSSKDGTWIHLLASAGDRPVRHNYRVRLALATPTAAAPRSRGGLLQPQGDVKTSHWRPGELHIVGFRTRSLKGRRRAWLEISRDHFTGGGRLAVPGSRGKNEIVVYVPPEQ